MRTLIESKLLRAALDGALPRLLDIGFTPDLLRSPHDEAFRRLLAHFSKYRELPSAVTAKEIFKGLGNVVALKKDCADSAEYYWDTLLNDELNMALTNAFDEISSLHSQDKIYGRTLLNKILESARVIGDKYTTQGSVCQTSEGMGRFLLAEYEMVKTGEIPGIPIDPRFVVLVEALMCLRPAHITSIIARSKVGKTWLALLLSLYAAAHGTRVLLTSMEMIKPDLTRRLACLHGELNYDAALKGYLVPDQHEKYKEILADADALRGFWANLRFIEQSAITDIDSVERQAHAFDAQLVVADAFYDFPADGKFTEDWKRIRHNLRKVREVSLATKRHWILTTQFGKDAKRSADDYAVGGTDAINFVSNTTIYMLQDVKDREHNFVKIRIGRSRETKAAHLWKHHWDFVNMNLTSVGIVKAPTERPTRGF